MQHPMTLRDGGRKERADCLQHDATGLLLADSSDVHSPFAAASPCFHIRSLYLPTSHLPVNLCVNAIFALSHHTPRKKSPLGRPIHGLPLRTIPTLTLKQNYVCALSRPAGPTLDLTAPPSQFKFCPDFPFRSVPLHTSSLSQLLSTLPTATLRSPDSRSPLFRPFCQDLAFHSSLPPLMHPQT